MHLKLIEPLNMLFKDGLSRDFRAPLKSIVLTRSNTTEVRELGLKLGMPEHLVFRHPFPVSIFSCLKRFLA